MRLLNIGCGGTFHPAWTNIDVVAASPLVIAHDIRKGLPFPESAFDACYTSHMLEHLTRDEARDVLKEAHRVLRPGGVLRVVVPDLESIIRHYVDALERVRAGESEATADYDWMMLELYDQAARSFPGGEMGRYLSQAQISNRDFVRSRIGSEAERFWEQMAAPRRPLLARARSYPPARLLQKIRLLVASTLVGVVAGRGAKRAFAEGLFRNSGEVHRWMYDRTSLGRLLEEVGFHQVEVCAAHASRIAGFEEYGLDTEGGKARKPDSLYMEGVKP